MSSVVLSRCSSKFQTDLLLAILLWWDSVSSHLCTDPQVARKSTFGSSTPFCDILRHGSGLSIIVIRQACSSLSQFYMTQSHYTIGGNGDKDQILYRCGEKPGLHPKGTTLRYFMAL